MTRLLIINGSPHRRGTLAEMLHTIGNEAERQGAEVDFVNVAGLKFSPCIGCMRCRSLGRCAAFDGDDASLMATKLRQADAIVIGSPTYWASMSGQLKLMLDRVVYAVIDSETGTIPKPRLNGKRLGIVATCNASRLADMVAPQASATVKSIKRVFAWSGTKSAGSVKLYSARQCQSLPSGTIKRLKALARRLVK